MATAVEHVVDVDPWMLKANDDAPAAGRVQLLAGCGACNQGTAIQLPAGRWVLEHNHGQPWTAHLVRLPSLGAAVDR
jgi:hypothetical protein